MWLLTNSISFFLSSVGGVMRAFGVVALVGGLALAGFAFNMDVSVHVESRDFGYGIVTPAMDVANADKMAQRQNLLIFSGVLAIVGAILVGFSSVRPRPEAPVQSTAEPPHQQEPLAKPAAGPTSVSICPECRSMGPGDAVACGRCGATLTEQV